MTKEEIKQSQSVADVLRQYGVKISRGRCKCFVHGGKNLNMSVNRLYAHCFKCGASVDIFGVVQHFENCDFKKAFEILGGEKPASARIKHKARIGLIKQSQLEVAEKLYQKAFDLWCAADYVKTYYTQTHDQSVYQHYAYAMTHMSSITQNLEEKEANLYELRKRI